MLKRLTEKLNRMAWLLGPGTVPGHDVVPVTYEAYVEMLKKQQKTYPCKSHIKAARSVLEASDAGLNRKRFLHRCPECKWLIEK
jgi:hypothetical protein